MASVGAGFQLLLLLLVGVLISQHAVHADDDTLQVRALKVDKYADNEQQRVLADLYTVVADSDITALIWTNKSNARDAIPLLNPLDQRGFPYLARTSLDYAYSFYYNSSMFSNVSAKYIYPNAADKIFVATFELADFVGAPLTLAAFSTKLQVSTNLFGTIAANRDHPFALFGDFGQKLLETIQQVPGNQTDRVVRGKFKKGSRPSTKPALFLSGMARSLISADDMTWSWSGLQHIRRYPMYSTFNLTVLKSELSAFTRRLTSTYQYPMMTPEARISARSMRRPVPPHSLQPEQFSSRGGWLSWPNQRYSARRNTPDRPYERRVIPPSTSTGVELGSRRVAGQNSAGRSHELGSRRVAGQNSAGRSPARRPSSPRSTPTSRTHHAAHHLPSSTVTTSLAQLHGHGPTGHLGTAGNSSPNQHADRGDDKLRVGALVVPAYAIDNRISVLNGLFSAVQIFDVAVLMWTERDNARDAIDLQEALNKKRNHPYFVETSIDSAFSFYYNSKIFANVSITSIAIHESSHPLCMATFKLAEFVGAPISVVAFFPVIQTLAGNQLKAFLRDQYSQTSLVAFANFIDEHSELAPGRGETRLALSLNSMETSCIRDFNPTMAVDWLHYFQQPPAYSEFNLTLLREELSALHANQRVNHIPRSRSPPRGDRGYDAAPRPAATGNPKKAWIQQYSE